MWISGIFIILCIEYKADADESCIFSAKTNTHVERELVGAGFHRFLTTSLSINTSLNLNLCYLLVKEIIPSGAYCDPYELKHLWEFSKNSYYVPEFVNVELPEQFSSDMRAYIFAKPDAKVSDSYKFNISLPIHLRYHRAKRGSEEPLEEKIVFPHPSLYIYCESEIFEDKCSLTHLEPCPPSGNQKCIWLPINTFYTTDFCEAIVPVGNLDLGDTVLLTTTAITFGALLLLLQSLFKSSPTFSSKSIT